MTIEQKRKILITIQNLEHDIEELKRVRMELASSEFASASLSSVGGSKTYTRQSVGQLAQVLRQMTIELKQYKKMLNPCTSSTTKIVTVYS